MRLKERFVTRLTPSLIAALPSLLTGWATMGSAAESPHQASTRSQVVHAAMRESVRIQVSSGGEVERSATGVVIRTTPATDGRPARSIIVTNAHVVDPAELKNVTYTVLLELHGRVVQTLPATLEALGQVPDVDLALLRVDASLPVAELGQEESIDVGDDVVVIGAPYGRSLSVSGGLVSQLEPDESAGELLRYKGMKTDAAIGYGCSGGGVFEVPTGKLIGIVEGYRTARVTIDDKRGFDVPMPGETFVAPVTKLRQFFAAHLPAAPVVALGQASVPAKALPETTAPAVH